MGLFHLPLFQRRKRSKARQPPPQPRPSTVQGLLTSPSEAPSTNSAIAIQSRERFQVQLSNVWQDLDFDADEKLRRALLAGLQNVTLEARGQFYEYSLQRMEQRNLQTGRVRRLRAPPMASSGNTNGFHHPTLLQQRRRWNEEEGEQEDDEESLGSSVSAASPSYGTSRRMRQKVAAVTAAGAVTGVCVVGGDYLFGEGELYDGLAEGTEAAIDWTAEATKTVGDFLENVL